MSVVLTDFVWYPNGYTSERVKVGDERDFGRVTNGLLEAKMIGEVADESVTNESATPVVVTERKRRSK